MASPMLIDTDIASYLIKGRFPSVDARFAAVDPSRVCMSVVTKSELLFGLRRLEPWHRINVAGRQFLTAMTTLPWDDDAAEVHADIRFQLESSGARIAEMDMMIAAHAIALGATLVTNNTRHFSRLAPTLIIENWASNPTP